MLRAPPRTLAGKEIFELLSGEIRREQFTKAVKVKTKPKGAPWWPNGLGLQALTAGARVPSLVWKQIPQAKQLRKTKNRNKTKYTPQDAFKFYKNYTTSASVTVGKG